MVDPSKITNYNATAIDLEEMILFWILAAGKNGTIASKNLHKLMLCTGGYVMGPFKALSIFVNNQYCDWLPKYRVTTLLDIIKKCGIGCYTHKSRTIAELINARLDLRTCAVEDLESIYGIGPKTARCFILHSRAGARFAGLDTHILKFLNMMGVYGVPKSTPSSRKEYKRLEAAFLGLADRYKRTPADLDLVIWNEFKIIK